MFLSEGDVYEGELDPDSGLPHGLGKFSCCASGDVTQAEFSHDKPHGQGSLSKRNGDLFAGRFSHGRMDTGCYLYAKEEGDGKAVRYRGSFKDDLPHGTGSLEFRNGDVYEGAFVHGQAQGAGRYASFTGDVTCGQFHRGRPMRGSKRFASTGNRFVGEFDVLTSSSAGVGMVEFGATGDVYRGQFGGGVGGVGVQFHGRGEYLFKSTGLRVTCATWVHGQPSGAIEVAWPEQHGAVLYGMVLSSTTTGNNNNNNNKRQKRELVTTTGVRFGDGAWLESGSSNRHYYADGKRECRAIVVEEEAVGCLLVGIAPVRFPSLSSPSTEEDGSQVGLLLACHQRLQYDLNAVGESARRRRHLWVRPSSSDAADSRAFWLDVARRATSHNTAAVCLVGGGGGKELARWMAGELECGDGLEWDHHDEHGGGRAMGGSDVLLFLAIETGFGGAVVDWMRRQLDEHKKKTLVVVWTGGNPNAVPQSCQELSDVVSLLLMLS